MPPLTGFVVCMPENVVKVWMFAESLEQSKTLPAALQTSFRKVAELIFWVCAWPVMMRRAVCVVAVCKVCWKRKTTPVCRIATSRAKKAGPSSANSSKAAPSLFRARRQTKGDNSRFPAREAEDARAQNIAYFAR